jgi:glutathionyl-hydroquinone reductase
MIWGSVMTALLKGQIYKDWLDKEIKDGEFIRDDSTFRNWITVDGSAGVSGEAGFKAEAGRYHLYVSHACPWAHRTVIFRKLKKLENLIGLSVVEPDMLEQGWSFAQSGKGTADTVNHFDYVHQLYTLADPQCTTQVTVPILWDKKNKTVVNNESSEIIRIFNNAFNHITGDEKDFYPQALMSEIDSINDIVYQSINNGVYRCGFAKSQQAYEKSFNRLFKALDELELRLSKQAYLVGNQLTEADWRLFTTLVRFDVVYVGHFKCNLRRIADYPNLFNYLKALYQMEGIAETVHIDYIKRHYYFSHEKINPSQIIPVGPEIDLMGSHDRDHFLNSINTLKDN